MVVFNLMFALSVIQTDSVIQNTTIKSFNQFCPSLLTQEQTWLFSFGKLKGSLKKPQNF